MLQTEFDTLDFTKCMTCIDGIAFCSEKMLFLVSFSITVLVTFHTLYVTYLMSVILGHLLAFDKMISAVLFMSLSSLYLLINHMTRYADGPYLHK